jgi:hypothetical protein
MMQVAAVLGCGVVVQFNTLMFGDNFFSIALKCACNPQA